MLKGRLDASLNGSEIMVDAWVLSHLIMRPRTARQR
jgi:hypothetical protein